MLTPFDLAPVPTPMSPKGSLLIYRAPADDNPLRYLCLLPAALLFSVQSYVDTKIWNGQRVREYVFVIVIAHIIGNTSWLG